MCDWSWVNPIKAWKDVFTGDPLHLKKDKKVAPTPKGPETIKAPTQADASITKTGDAERTRAALAAAQNIKTTSRGLGSSASTTKKTLLGQ